MSVDSGIFENSHTLLGSEIRNADRGRDPCSAEHNDISRLLEKHDCIIYGVEVGQLQATFLSDWRR
jgi:hypothetical protein